MRVAVALPCNWPFVATRFFTSAVSMFAAAERTHEVALMLLSGAYLDEMREQLAESVVKQGFDCAVWLDADQHYPRETITRLVAHVASGRDVVGGVTPNRPHGWPHVWRFANRYGSCVRDEEFTAGRGLVRVDALGFGGVATSRHALEAIGRPRFLRRWDEENASFVGEDFSFFSRCREKDIDVWCDSDLVFEHIAVGTIKLTPMPIIGN